MRLSILRRRRYNSFSCLLTAPEALGEVEGFLYVISR